MAQQKKRTARFTAYLICSGVLILGLAFGYRYYRESLKHSDKVVGRIGPYEIRESQIQYQMELNKLMIPQKTDRAFAESQVKETFAYQTILQKYGWVVGPKELRDEAVRIETNTRARRLLEKIQGLPDFGRHLYDDIFVRGTLVHRVIFNDFYFSHPELHQGTRQQALRIASDLKGLSKSVLLEKSKMKNLTAFELRLSEKDGYSGEPVVPSAATAPAKRPHPGLVDPERPKPSKAERKDVSELWWKTHQQFEGVDGALLFDEGERWGLFFPEEWKPEKKLARGVLVIIPKKPFQIWIQGELKKLEASAPSGEI